jgi:peptidyl-prolyl cis-trans isomerase B (cyclophilin B)
MSESSVPRVRLTTSEGPILVQLWPDVAPGHAENFLKLTRQGFYDGLSFHRILPSFVIQGGCPRGDGTGGPGWKVKAEFNDRKHDKGVLSMARSADPDSAGSQFFICLGREHCQHLDGQYTAFGTVVEGLDVVDRIAATPLADPRAGTPAEAPTIVEAVIVTAE